MEFPIYRKRTHNSTVTIVKVLSESVCLYVSSLSGTPWEIQHIDFDDAEFVLGNYKEPTTAAEFTAAYEAVQEKIKQAVNA